MATLKRRGESLTDTAAQLPASLWLDGDEEGGRFGTDTLQAWRFDEDRVAVQARRSADARQLGRREGATLFADALVGRWTQTWLIPCKDDAEMRQIVLGLLAETPEESDPPVTAHRPQSSGKESFILDREGSLREIAPPERDTVKARKPPSDELFEDRGCFGTSAVCAFPRFGSYVFQVGDSRLWPFFARRKGAEIVGHSVGGWGQLRQYRLPIKGKTKAAALLRKALASIAGRKGEA